MSKIAKTVFVGLSGGVDSSVAALRLKKQGYNVVGVFIKVWHPDWMVCNWEEERLDAMRVAAHLQIPFLTCDAVEAYKDDVADYFISEYRAGRTPNPDVMCNQFVKFGRFIEFAKSHGADFIATGHYVQKLGSEELPELHRGFDQNKDQSYFLWTLHKEQLQYSLFPVGNTKKEVIRQEAAKAGLPTAAKKDSQGICFLGHVDIPEFLSHYIELYPGPVLDIAGKQVGEHKGAFVYTRGQRHGFTITIPNAERKKYYVVTKDISANTITVDETPPMQTTTDEVVLKEVNLRQVLQAGDVLEAQIRYRQTPFPIKVISISRDELCLTYETSNELPATGQSCVLYRGSLCVGGGIIG